MTTAWVGKRRVFTSDNLVLVVALLIATSAVIVQAKLGMAQRWHAAITWTLVPFSAAVMIYRRYWSSWRFWTSLAICLVLHLALMWEIFSRLLPKVQWLGTAYAIPFEFLEGFVLLIAVALLMRGLGEKGKYIHI